MASTTTASTTTTPTPPTPTISTIATTNIENATTTTHSVTTSINETANTTEENERTTIGTAATAGIDIGELDSKNNQGAANAVIGGAAAVIIIAGVLGFVAKKFHNQKQTYKPNSQEEYISLTSKSKEHSIRTKDFVQMVQSNEIRYNAEYRDITTIDTRTNVIRLSSDVAKQHSGPPGFSLNRYSSCHKLG